MPVSPAVLPQPTIAARLRAAGCVYAEEEAELLVSEAGTAAELAAMVERRASGLPLEQIIGWAGFCGLRIAVEPGIFVPRRRTEFLVSQAIDLVSGDDGAISGTIDAARRPDDAGDTRTKARTVVVDLCCGSGAVGAALAADLDHVELYAADVDATAVRCARHNTADAGGRVFQGDLYAALPAELRGRVDLLAVNAPYVPADEIRLMPPEARNHEPLFTLSGGADGLDVQRRVAAEAALWLAPGGHLLLETSERQAPDTIGIMEGNGLVPRVERSEELDATVVVGTRAEH
ncbi:putative protein N(5)-glutamine methyltransferase [Arthrobacter sp. H14]|uniref:putative protein N(5)-glutamine methyltransferase n=1 Tax=Arthrobacter sp. H14 TaxID=1312959 RepID=UPI00047EE0A7|nr:putative protein N(5)-glutamine methyltransferase [Arthrobacter sp. H14]